MPSTMDRMPKLPRSLSSHDRLPFEIAIDIVEAEISKSSKGVILSMLRRKAINEGLLVGNYIEPALRVMINNGLVKRCHHPMGVIQYMKTTQWGRRDNVLVSFRTPRYVYRYRPRSREALEALKLGRDLGPKPTLPRHLRAREAAKERVVEAPVYEQIGLGLE